eukprot:m.197606 g.197606  ORF g.197606 m.197606 type:complete len:226 (+) comp32663_c1_seq2:310-987(+)
MLTPWKFANPHIDPRQMEKRELTFAGKLVVIHQQPQVEIDRHKNTGMILWDAAYVLARYIETHHAHRIRDRRCIELGSGTGLVGIVAAVLGGNVTLTDMAEQLPLLRKNANDMHDKDKDIGDRIHVHELGWGNDVSHINAPFDVVVASEIVYDLDALPALWQCLLQVTTKDSLIIFAHKDRGLGESVFMHQLSKSAHFKFKHVPTAALDSDFRGGAIHVLQLWRC